MRFVRPLLFVFVISNVAIAGNISQQVITYRIDPINEISINGGTSSLVITVDKDSQKTSGSASWAITTNETNKRVIGSIDADMPPGIKLYVELEAPKGSLNRGAVSLSTDPKNLVTHISRVAENNLRITYKLITETDTDEVELQRVLTLVLTDGF